MLLAAAIVYGLTYAALLLVTLAYSIEYRAQVGVPVGVGRAIQRIGPITALLVGTYVCSIDRSEHSFRRCLINAVFAQIDATRSDRGNPSNMRLLALCRMLARVISRQIYGLALVQDNLNSREESINHEVSI